jgi:predicted DNA-binding antitoxin AbrB/MazE fold protein
MHAIYDGEVLRPEQPLDLEKNTRVRITIEAKQIKPRKRKKGKSFLQTAREIKIRGPKDWSQRVDDYLYGKDKDGET